MKTKQHKHTWIITTSLVVLAVLSIILIPKHTNYPLVFLGFAGGHLMIGLIALFTGWILTPQQLINKIWKKKKIEGYDFGWAPKWLYAFAFAAIILFFLAIHLFFTFKTGSILGIFIYTVLLFFSYTLFMGFLTMQGSKRQSKLSLPMTPLLPSGKGLVLDAGCGAGRTTVALGAVMPYVEIIAFDKFDADYIEGGGMMLLKKNLDIAQMTERVTIKKGNITNTGFETGTFDAIVSSYMYDHLGPHKLKALEESYRILKPGGRFLLIIVVRNVASFTIANFLCLLLPTRNKWKRWIEKTGFKLISDGNINEGAYFCFEKPE